MPRSTINTMKRGGQEFFPGFLPSSTSGFTAGREEPFAVRAWLEKYWDPFAVEGEWIRQWADILRQTRLNLELLKAGEVEIPEVFELTPLTSERVKANIRRVESASFYFVDDDETNLADSEE